MQSIRFRGIEISSDSDCYILSSVEPNEINVDMQESKVLNCDGAVYSNFSYDSRRVKISGTMCADCADELRLNRMELINAFDGKSLETVYYTIDMAEYHAECIGSVTLSPPEGLYQEFNISLILPKFYWHGKLYKHHIQGLNRTVTSKLSESVPFTTEITFSVKDSEGNTFAAERIDKYIALMTDEDYISLSTETDIVKLRYIPHDGEIITIDTDNMTVVSSLNGSLNKYLITFDRLVLNHGSNSVDYSGTVVSFINKMSSSVEGVAGIKISIVVAYDVTYSKKYIGV